MFYICKGYKPLSTCKNIWLWSLILHQCPHVMFPLCFVLVEKIYMDQYVLLNFTSTTIIFASFDVSMFRSRVYTFALAINYLNESWTPMHVIVNLFEVHDTTWLSMGHG
jgi:hypothetical protein